MNKQVGYLTILTIRYPAAFGTVTELAINMCIYGQFSFIKHTVFNMDDPENLEYNCDSDIQSPLAVAMQRHNTRRIRYWCSHEPE